MARILSLYRRRPNLIDVNLQSGPYAPSAIGLAAGKVAVSYDFQVSANFDGTPVAFATFQNVPASGGYRSPTAQDPIAGFDSEQFSQSRTPYLTRFKFNPADYQTGGAVNTIFTTAGVTDLTPIWLKVIQNNLDGSTNTASAPHLILPFSSQPNRTVLLAGTAPNETSLATSLEIQLPMQCNNIQIQNNGGAILFVAFEPTGPEFVVNPLATDFTDFYQTYNATSQVFVRGNGATTTFNLVAALRNNPLM